MCPAKKVSPGSLNSVTRSKRWVNRWPQPHSSHFFPQAPFYKYNQGDLQLSNCFILTFRVIFFLFFIYYLNQQTDLNILLFLLEEQCAYLIFHFFSSGVDAKTLLQ